MYLKFVYTFILILYLLGSCQVSNAQSYTYLYLGHTYDWSNPKGNTVDARILELDLSAYDGFWFGGDICSNTSLDPKTWQSLDEVFNLKSPSTFISLGNHDYRDDNLHLYYNVTGKSDFYTSTINSLVISVLNTNLNASDCHSLEQQYDMLTAVADTISEASHFILMMHHQIFSNIPGLEDFKSNGVCENYQVTCKGSPKGFEGRVYPKLVDIKKRGIEVLVLVGDTGWHKGGSWKSDDEIHFIASGINNSYYKEKAPGQLSIVEEDKVLEFKYNVDKRILDWKFIKLGNFK